MTELLPYMTESLPFRVSMVQVIEVVKLSIK